MAFQAAQLGDIYRLLSPERLGPYLRTCGGDRNVALSLYEWNAEVSAALWSVLAHTEVVLRNALHGELSGWSTQVYAGPTWYVAGGQHFRPQALDDISTARIRATKTGKPETPGRVVAELSFGFWRYLLGRSYDGTLWRWCLANAFPYHNGSRGPVSKVAGRLHEVRNRIAHHEPIHGRRIDLDLADALRLAGWISPVARDWIRSTSRVDDVLAAKPSP